MDREGVRQAGLSASHFEIHPVDDLVAMTGGMNEDVLLDEFMRQLIGNNPGRWGPGTSLPYVQLGNEMVGTSCPASLGWLVLRLCELAHRCEPSLVRVFPGLASPNNRPPEPMDPLVDDLYLTRTVEELEAVFYHIVRAALVVRRETADPDDAVRFEDVLPGIAGAWGADAATSLWGKINVATGTAHTDSTPPSEALPFDFDAQPDTFRDAVRAWCVSNVHPPFQVMDFHWYNSRGHRGGFLYLHAVKALAEALVTTMTSWWSGGADVRLWCTETGISSDRNPLHYAAQRVTVVEPDGRTWTCHGHVPSCADWGLLGGGLPPDPMLADEAVFEFRVDPGLIAAIADAADPLDAFPDLPEHWPAWVFTSEFEQAVQVWTRLSFLAGIGVEKVWWYSNIVSEVDNKGYITEFYTYGLTDDVMVSLFDPVDCTDADGDGDPDHCRVESAFERDSVEYRRRSKKRAFCAIKRWNQYLGNYRCARVLRRLDGLDGEAGNANQGFYAVVFRVGDDDAEHPFALVTWTDPQVFTACADPAAAEPLGACKPSRALVFVPADPLGTRPRVVQTIPREEVVDPAVYDPDGGGTLAEIADPCLADGDVLEVPAGGDPGCAGAKVWRFGPDAELDYTPAPGILPEILGVRVGVHAFHPPVLTLLPAGELYLYDDAVGAVESLFVLDSAALHPPGCREGAA